MVSSEERLELETETGVRTVTASEFKAKCLKIMDEVAETGERVVITKRGVPRVRVVPIVERPKSMYGVDKGKIKILGDVVSPMPPEWYSNPEKADEDLF